MKGVGTLSNISPLTRKEQILKLLLDNLGQWVDGPRLASEEVGGSEGLRRLRELRADGHRIQQRHHPDAERDIWQYRIVAETDIVPPTRPGTISQPPAKKLVFGETVFCDYCKGTGKRDKAECLFCLGRGWR